MNRQLKFSEAIREATDQAMGRDPSVYIVGLGVPDPKGIFGTTLGLQEKYGAVRVQDMPLSENAMTGVALGSALVGMRPIITHQRMDFALVAMEQMVNQAAKWHYMFGGKANVPMVVRMIIGRGWGQGPQHSQSLQAWFAHIPGLKVVMPTTAHDAKGLLAASIEDNNPVIFIEHRWLHNIADEVPAEYYTVPLGKARVMRAGSDVTIVGTSYMALEALRAAERLDEDGISAEVVDLRTIRPWDIETVLC
ncbi:MAG: alpha-ketoacid dehydrogenase subunit beta, partial [Proteobacteria bacterium]|nr:alpha-ketoacid dehydrogenase subunit beta [Pseudomonadota bacterium]